MQHSFSKEEPKERMLWWQRKRLSLPSIERKEERMGRIQKKRQRKTDMIQYRI